MVNPARAGMIPLGCTATPNGASKPRASGDDPFRLELLAVYEM